jgi:glycosyltransferase involved in cell wall biosynthesis
MSKPKIKTIDEYLNIHAGEHIKSPQKPNVDLVMVVPAYNEEAAVKNLLLSLNDQIYRNFELILVDNGSNDNTINVVEKTKPQLSYDLFILEEKKPGPGNARKKGMDEAVYRFYTKPDFSQELTYILATTDADAKPPKDWLKSIREGFNRHRPGGLAGTHIASKKTNETIHAKFGLKDYFNAASKLITFCAKNSIGQLKMSGPNSSFSVEAYCAAGGIEQPYIGSKVDVGEIKLLQREIQKAGFEVLPSYTPVVVSQRRHLFEILNGGVHGCYLTKNPQEGRFLTIRESEETLLEKALEEVPKAVWVDYQNEILKTVAKNIFSR